MEKIKVRFIIQIAGKPVENVEKALEHVLKKLKDEKDSFTIIEAEIVKPELDENTTLYSGFIEVTAKFENTTEILGFILDYTPTSIEVEEPTEITLNNVDFTGILNDFSHIILNQQSQIRNLRAQIHLNSKNKK